MENKEASKALSNICEGIFNDDDIECIELYIDQLEESLHCAETNFQTCNSDLASIGKLVGGSCFDHTYQLVVQLKQALDKATVKLSNEVKVFPWGYPGGKYMNFEYWKEWCMSNE